MPKVTVPDTYSPEDVEKALKMLDQAKISQAKEKERMKDPVYKARVAEKYRKAVIEQTLFVVKAKDAGIKVSPEEVNRIYDKKYGVSKPKV